MSCCSSAFELLLGTWPSACYQRVDVLSQLLDGSLHVGFRNYKSSPTRRARTENKKVMDHSRSSVNTREVSEGSVGVTDTLGPALLVLMARCKTRHLYVDKRPYRRVQQSCHTRSRQGSWGNVCVTLCVCKYSREHSRVYVYQKTRQALSNTGKVRPIVY